MGGFWSHRTNYILLAIYHNTRDVGLYTVSLAIPNLIANIPNQISLVLYPYISAIENKQDAIDLTSVIVKVSALVVFILYIPIFFWGEQILILIYGQDYSGLHLPLKLLFAAMFMDGIGSLLFNHFAGRGKPVYGSYKFLISIIFLIVGGILFIPQFGVSGAALGKLISALSASIFIIYLFSRDHSLSNIILINSIDIRIIKKILRKEL